MATVEEITQAKSMVPDTTLSDAEIGAIIDASECLNQAVGKIWGQLAGVLANLVNISEAGSSRSMGQLSDNALKMAKYYADLGCGAIPGETTSRTRIRQIERA